MVIEIIAGRIMAPHLGVSLYTWTSIIGVILAGIAIGNYMGGKNADKKVSHKNLAFVFLLSGISVISIAYLATFINKTTFYQGVPLIFSTLAYSISVFFAPAMFLSFITPMVIKCELNSLSKTGSTVGTIYGVSAIGSIIGTFTAGYFLINSFGTKSIVQAIGILLIIIAALLLKPRINKHDSSIALIILFLGGTFFLPPYCDSESNYYCINIVKDDVENFYTLRLNHLVHAFVSTESNGDVNSLGYAYEKIFALLVSMDFKPDETFSSLTIGGGGYVGPRYLESNYPASTIHVVEIDPAVTKTAHDKLGLNTNTKIKTFNTDARMLFKNNPGLLYDIILADAFDDLSVPYHITTKEFNDEIKTHLSPEGFYAVNIIDGYEHGRFLASYIATLKETFSNVYLLPQTSDWKNKARNTFVVVGSQKKLDFIKWNAAVLPVDIDGVNSLSDEDQAHLRYVVPDDQVDEFIKEKEAIILTDNYVPVDNLLSPVFQRAF